MSKTNIYFIKNKRKYKTLEQIRFEQDNSPEWQENDNARRIEETKSAKKEFLFVIFWPCLPLSIILTWSWIGALVGLGAGLLMYSWMLYSVRYGKEPMC